jgi:transaldolase
VPATTAGVGAIEELTARAVNVNVTLLFSVERYEQVIEAYLRGLERRVAAGKPLSGITSVASFFVSRIDAKADALLAPSSSLRGQVAIANAHCAYGRCLARFAGERWTRLKERGARTQRPLWASTGTKDPTYSDVLYVERLVAPGVINTMPEKTLRAFARHGRVERTLGADSDAANAVLSAAAMQGVDLEAITRELEREGVTSFGDSYEQLLDCIGSKLGALSGAHPSYAHRREGLRAQS